MTCPVRVIFTGTHLPEKERLSMDLRPLEGSCGTAGRRGIRGQGETKDECLATLPRLFNFCWRPGGKKLSFWTHRRRRWNSAGLRRRAFTAKLFCNVEFLLERLRKLIGPCESFPNGHEAAGPEV